MVVMTPIPAPSISANPGNPKVSFAARVQSFAPARKRYKFAGADEAAEAPDPQVIQPAPDVANMKMKLSDLTIAQIEPTCPSPRSL